MYALILICGMILGRVLSKIYLFIKKNDEISEAKINDIIITKNNKIGILTGYHRNFECLDIADDIIYEIKDVHTGTIQTVSKDMVCRVVKGYTK